MTSAAAVLNQSLYESYALAAKSLSVKLQGELQAILICCETPTLFGRSYFSCREVMNPFLTNIIQFCQNNFTPLRFHLKLENIPLLRSKVFTVEECFSQTFVRIWSPKMVKLEFDHTATKKSAENEIESGTTWRGDMSHASFKLVLDSHS